MWDGIDIEPRVISAKREKHYLMNILLKLFFLNFYLNLNVFITEKFLSLTWQTRAEGVVTDKRCWRILYWCISWYCCFIIKCNNIFGVVGVNYANVCQLIRICSANVARIWWQKEVNKLN